MIFLKKVNALVLGLAVLLAVSCGGDEKENPAPGNNPPANCKLTKHVRSVNSSQATSEFIYDNAGKLVRVNFSSPVNPSGNTYEVVTYNADRQIAKVEDVERGYSRTYTYNANGKPDTIYHLNGSVKSGFMLCEYNVANQLVKWSTFSMHETVSSNYTEIAYPAPNRSTELRYQRNAAGVPVLESATEKLYDEKWHPYSQLGYFFEQVIFSNHNLLSSTMTYHGQPYINKQTYTYDYNASGYPVKQTEVQNGSIPTIDTFSYNCQ